jgi:methylated-DNA-[protein]-cysteine S-methyltransferase
MTEQSYLLFDTAIGCCGLVWSARGVVAVQLPERDSAATRSRLRRRHPEVHEAAPSPDIRHAVEGIVGLLAGAPSDLTAIAIDDGAVAEFNRRVYAVARTIAPGETMTYGEVAERLGDRALAREVGQALGENPTPLVVPCHRVLAADGRSGGFSGAGGVVTKLRLLSIEGAEPGGPTLFEKLPLAARPRRG